MECQRERNSREFCNCSSPNCPRNGVCCECISRHIKKRQLPGCCFPNELEPDHRSFEDFAKFVSEGKI